MGGRGEGAARVVEEHARRYAGGGAWVMYFSGERAAMKGRDACA